ncbi:MAG: ATP-binding protein [Phycisphaerales bacterium]|nr:ATP-binding protein [Phycisphaerales bacterium]
MEIRETRKSVAGRGVGDARRHAPAEARTRSATALCQRLRDELGEHRFARYFADGAGLSVDDQRIEVRVATPFMAEVMNRRLAPTLRRAAAGAGSDQPLEVRVRVDSAMRKRPHPTPADESTPEGRDPPAPAAPPKDPSRSTQRPQPRPTHQLEEFIVGDSNRLAYTAAVRVAEGIDDEAFSPLFIHGGSGLGKTHLLQGIAARFARVHPGVKTRCVTAEAFTNEYISAIRSNTTDRFRRAWRSVRLLCLDDVHFLRGKQSTQVELLHTLDAIGLQQARIVLASDEHPRRIEQLSQHLVSRCMSGAVIHVADPDEELRRRLVAAFAARRGLTLTPDGLDALAVRAAQAGSAREIEGLLTQIEAVARLAPDVCATGERGIDAGAVRRSLGLSDGSAKKGRAAHRCPVRIDGIVGEVCRSLRLEPTDLLGAGRHRRVVLARGLISRLARELTTLSFPDIARALHRPNHSTIITAYRRISGQIDRGEGVEVGPDLAGVTLADLASGVRARVLEAAGR